METINKIINYIQENWFWIAPIIYEILVRTIPTSKNWSIISLLIPNRKIVPLILLVLLSLNVLGQTNATYKTLRLVNVLDSTTVLPINLSLYYNEQSRKPRIYFNNSWHDLATSGGAAGVTAVTGTTNRITSSGGSTPVIDISASYTGQNTITTLGLVTVGSYQATPIDDSYITSAITWNGKQNSFVITSVKTTNYNAIVNDFVPCDNTSGSFTINLPVSPANKSIFGAKLVIQGGTNTITIAAGGFDVFNKVGGSTSLSLSLVNQAVQLEYNTGIWYVTCTDAPISNFILNGAVAGGGLTGTYPNPTVVTNANLTGVITSVGNATSITSQTGTGSKFVVDTSPLLITPNIGTPSAGNLANCTFPTLNQNTSGTASNLSGTPALPNGTTATTQAANDNSTKLATTAYADAVTTGSWKTTGTTTVTTPTITGKESWNQAAESSTNTFQTWTQANHTGGTPKGWVYNGGTLTGLTAGTELTYWDLNLASNVTYNAGTVALNRFAIVRPPTVNFVSASSMTDAATFTIMGAPVAGSNATINRGIALYVAADVTRLDGTLWHRGSAWIVGCQDNTQMTLSTNALTRYTILSNGGHQWDGAAGSGSSNNAFWLVTQAGGNGSNATGGLIWNGGAFTASAGATELNDWTLNFSPTCQFTGGGSFPLQRTAKISARTYSATTATTITTSSTLSVSGAPIAGTNMTITNPYAITAETGNVYFDGKAVHGATNTAAGTTGNQTINKASGTVNIAAAGTTVTVTNSLVTTSSIVYCVLRTNDGTATGIKNVVPSAGSFVITLNAAATAEVSIGFIVFN